MPFLRHARDKRGYETTFVMHSSRPGAGQASGRTRLLYMFRSPSNRKVGRNLLDPEVMEALEHTHPDLTFDWTALLRTPALTAPDPDRDRSDRDRERDRDRGRQRRDERRERQGERRERHDERRERHDERRERQSEAKRPAAAAATPAPAVIFEDDSLPGRVLGAAEAARLRAAFAELIQRIVRRSRTPEERDRLTERAARLNPDDWLDEPLVKAGAAQFGDELEAIRQELPRRRRGRRGGRSRDRDDAVSGATSEIPDGELSEMPDGEPSEIPEGEPSEIINGNEHHEMEASADRNRPDHGDRVGPGHAAPGADDATPESDGDEVHERD